MPIDVNMNSAQAANIYSNSAKNAGAQSVARPDSGASFSDILRESAESAIDTS